jgi:hypothetical protein
MTIRSKNLFLILIFRRVLNVVGDPPASEFYMPTVVILHNYPPPKMEQTGCSETLAYKLQTPGIHLE